eukprot:36610-Eustigmatos_ZCMA.PRE.1
MADRRHHRQPVGVRTYDLRPGSPHVLHPCQPYVCRRRDRTSCRCNDIATPWDGSRHAYANARACVVVASYGSL